MEAHHGEQAERPEPALFHQHEIVAYQHALDIEHGPPAQHVGEGCHSALNPTAHAFLGTKVIDDPHLAALPTHARQFAHDLLRIGHHRHDIHGDHGVERCVIELEITRIHLVQTRDVAETLSYHPFARLFQHVRRQVDAH